MENYIKSVMLSDAKKYGHRASEFGVGKVFAKVMENKADIIEMLKKHHGYNGNLQVVIKDVEFERTVDDEINRQWVNDILFKIKARDKVVKRVDENGNSFDAALTESYKGLAKSVNLTEITGITVKSVTVDKFDCNGEYTPTVERFYTLSNLVDMFRYYTLGTINKSMADELNRVMPELKIGEGMKTSRAMNKIFAMFGLDKDKEYLKQFPKYSDNINVKMAKRNIVISVNPIDFMRMSFGNTWASCHTIDINNIRRTSGQHYSGAYCNGVVSYMLDKVSFIMNVIDPKDENFNAEHPEDTDKIYRCMFHWQDGNLIQGRVYPQNNDGNLDLSKKLRHIMQEALCEMLGIPFVNNGMSGDTWKQCGKSCHHNGDYTNGHYTISWSSNSSHYRDYECYDTCNVSYIKNYDFSDGSVIEIGYDAICFNCGYIHDTNGYDVPRNRLAHNYCQCTETENNADEDTLVFAY